MHKLFAKETSHKHVINIQLRINIFYTINIIDILYRSELFWNAC